MFKSFLNNYNSLITESFRDAEAVFSRTNDPAEVKTTLQKFKELAKKGKLMGSEKDITYWVKKPFDALKNAVSGAEQIKSKSDKKAKSKKLAQNGDWIAIAPLSKEASCYYGANTQWCTAANNSNHFNSYFHTNEINLIYFINRKTGEKLAAASKEGGEHGMECFDAQDNTISADDIFEKTGLDPDELFSNVEAQGTPKVAREEQKQEWKKTLHDLLARDTSVKAVRDMNDAEKEEIKKWLDVWNYGENQHHVTEEEDVKLAKIKRNLDDVGAARSVFKYFILDFEMLKKYLSLPELNPRQEEAMASVLHNVQEKWKSMNYGIEFQHKEVRDYLNNPKYQQEYKDIIRQAHRKAS